jgi:tetratricopeptide (TPR) repeat protein
MKFTATALAVLFFLGGAICLRAQQEQKPAGPMGEAQVIALVAGDALPENIVHFVTVRGLAFRPGASYLEQLKAAGAAPSVIDALKTAKVIPSNAPEHDADADLLKHLVAAATLKKSGKYSEAESELAEAAKTSFDETDTAFVMADVFKGETAWEKEAALCEGLLEKDPSYPEAHTKCSYAFYKTNDVDDCLSQAKAGIEAYSDDAEAHKDAGLAYEDIGNDQASLDEYNQALRIKPDYAVVHYDIGYFYDRRMQFQQAIPEYRKAIALDPAFAPSHANLGLMLEDTGDIAGAIQEERKAKELAPRDFDARLKLAHALYLAQSFQESADEYQQLEAFAPDSAMCHRCYAYSLFAMYKFDEAEKEFQKSIALDPSDAEGYAGLGEVAFQKKDYDSALKYYERAAEMDPTSVNARAGAGEVLLVQKKYPEACEKLKEAVEVRPANAGVHDLYGQALEAAGNLPAAISEFRQSVAIDKIQPGVVDELASAYEKSGDWAHALQEYKQAVTVQGNLEAKSLMQSFAYRMPSVSPAEAYESAEARYSAYLDELRATGKSAEADELDKKVQASLADVNLSDQFDAANAKAMDLLKQGHLDDAEPAFKNAVSIGLKLQPPDLRVVMALWRLGNCYMARKDFPDAQAAFDQELQIATTLYGKDSPTLTVPLQSLAFNALLQQDYMTAEKYYNRAIDLNEKTYGAGSRQVADVLVNSVGVYVAEKKYAEAEPYLERALEINESLNGKDSIYNVRSLGPLCSLYDKWENWQKALPCDQRLVTLIEGQFGENNPQVIIALQFESHAFRHLGKTEDADKVDQKISQLQKIAPAGGSGSMFGTTNAPKNPAP